MQGTEIIEALWRDYSHWAIGYLFIVVVFGDYAVGVFLKCLRAHQRLPKKGYDKRSKPVPPSLMGIMERAAIATAAVFSPATAILAAGGWLALKMATNWNRVTSNDMKEATERIRGSQAALLAGLL